ncbi:hypothetical protein Tco_0315615 [Tanacetum coccineum]
MMGMRLFDTTMIARILAGKLFSVATMVGVSSVFGCCSVFVKICIGGLDKAKIRVVHGRETYYGCSHRGRILFIQFPAWLAFMCFDVVIAVYFTEFWDAMTGATSLFGLFPQLTCGIDNGEIIRILAGTLFWLQPW